MRAMILAAGRGDRLRPLTDTLPKSLVDVAGRSLLERHLDRLQDAGMRDVVINLGWLGEQIEERIGDGRAWDLRVRYSREGDDVLETGGGIVKALPLLGDAPFLVINADIYTDMPVPRDVPAAGCGAHLVLVPTPDYRDRGDFGLDRGAVNNERQLTFSGVSAYRPQFFDGCEPGRFSVVPLLREAVGNGRVSGALYDGLWADVGTPERLRALDAAARRSG